MSAQRSALLSEVRRIVICDYNALLLSVTRLLRMSPYCVFQAHNGSAAEELCVELPKISLLVLNTYGTGVEVGGLIRRVRIAKPGMPVLHIGFTIPEGLPADVPTLAETFTPEQLLLAVSALMERRRSSRTAGDEVGIDYSPAPRVVK